MQCSEIATGVKGVSEVVNDINGDGFVNRADVDTIAMAAVSLKRDVVQ